MELGSVRPAQDLSQGHGLQHLPYPPLSVVLLITALFSVSGIGLKLPLGYIEN